MQRSAAARLAPKSWPAALVCGLVGLAAGFAAASLHHDGAASDPIASRAPSRTLQGLTETMRALGSVSSQGSESQAEMLLEKLEHTYGEERAVVVRALGQSRSQLVLPKLLEMAHGAAPRDRALAIEALGWHADPEAVAALVELSEHRSTLTRYGVIRALAKTGAPKARAFFLAAARDPASLHHRDALLELPQWKDEEVTDVLVDRLEGDDSRLASTAAQGLADQGTGAALAALEDTLADPRSPSDVRAIALRAMAIQEGPASRARLVELALASEAEIASSVITTLGEVVGEAAVPDLLRIARLRRDVAHAAMGELGELATPAAVEALGSLLLEEDVPVDGYQVASTLGYLQGDDVDGHLRTALKRGVHKDAVINALSNPPARAGFGPLLEAELEGLATYQRERLLRALLVHDPARARRVLKKQALRGETPADQIHALSLLAEEPGPEVTSLLMTLARSGEGNVGVDARVALLNRRASHDWAREALQEDLDPRRPGSMNAFRALAARGGPGVKDVLVDVAFSSASTSDRVQRVTELIHRGGLADRQSILARVTSEIESPSERAQLLDTLAISGEHAAIDELEDLAEEAGPARDQVLRSLANRAPQRALALAETMRESDEVEARQAALSAAETAGGTAALEGALFALDDKDQMLSHRAAQMLINQGGDQATEALVGLLEDKPEEAFQLLDPLVWMASGDIDDALVPALGGLDEDARATVAHRLRQDADRGRKLLQRLVESDEDAWTDLAYPSGEGAASQPAGGRGLNPELFVEEPYRHRAKIIF